MNVEKKNTYSIIVNQNSEDIAVSDKLVKNINNHLINNLNAIKYRDLLIIQEFIFQQFIFLQQLIDLYQQFMEPKSVVNYQNNGDIWSIINKSDRNDIACFIAPVVIYWLINWLTGKLTDC